MDVVHFKTISRPLSLFTISSILFGGFIYHTIGGPLNPPFIRITSPEDGLCTNKNRLEVRVSSSAEKRKTYHPTGCLAFFMDLLISSLLQSIGALL